LKQRHLNSPGNGGQQPGRIGFGTIHPTGGRSTALQRPRSLHVMELLEPTTAEELVRQFTPELIPQPEIEFRIISQIGSFMLCATAAFPLFFYAFTTLGIQTQLWPIILSSITGVGGAVSVTRWSRRDYEEQLRHFSKELRDSPWKFYEAVARKFESEIQRQRARTIGPDSEWGRARLRLESAAQEAERSVAYWTQRLSLEPNNDIAQTQITAATQLRDKFRSALSGLDERARLLVSFFNDCEARVAVLQSTKRDYDEIRKLDRLADGSDEIVIRAQETLASISTSFVSEALRVASALGGLERVGLINLAGEATVDQIETLADRIAESAERDRTALEQLPRSV
jgi:hypothetical protein